MSSAKDILDAGDANRVGLVAKEVKLGSRLAAGWMVDETLAVSSAAATPSYTVLQMILCEVTGATGGNGAKSVDPRGTAPATGHAAANAGGTSIVFNAEVTGTSGLARCIYFTSDPVKISGVAKKAMTDDLNTAV